MFNPFHPQLALAGVTMGAPSHSNTNAKASVSAMLSGMRGRAMGRGAAPMGVPSGPTHAPSSSPEPVHQEDHELLDALAHAITQMNANLETVRADVSLLKHKGTDSEKVFNALHAEMGDYKRDFVFEHIKPLLRPLLFVFDSLDEFDSEMVLYEEEQAKLELRPNALKATKVRANISFVRDQLEQALASCDVEPLPTPSGRFDGHDQKAISSVPVAPELDGTIQSVTRQGWTLKGHTLRPTEVIVGKALRGDQS